MMNRVLGFASLGLAVLALGVGVDALAVLEDLALLALRLGVPFADADDLHPPANIAKMTAGVPLDDDDRYPWLEAVEVQDSDAVSGAAQDALELTRMLGGYVVSSYVSTGEEGSASITVRVPVAKVQDAIAGLSGLGRIVSQQVNVQDQQESIDALERRMRSLLAKNTELAARIDELERKYSRQDAELRVLFNTLRKLMQPSMSKSPRRIGFHSGE